MKYFLPNVSIRNMVAAALLPSLIALVAANPAAAQKNRNNKAFAITSDTKGSANWVMVREIDLGNGQELRTVFAGNNPAIEPLDAVSRKAITEFPGAEQYGKDFFKTAMNTGVAAAAYDKAHKRLYFTPMYIDQLRYIDMSGNDPKVYFVQAQKLNPTANLLNGAQQNTVTRMAIAADGNGYALTNDANHLVKFTTGRKPVITDLGPLQDAPENKASVHTQCAGWGGDMVAGTNNTLYLITSRNNVFKIDIETRMATSLGAIKGVEANFTANGAAVTEDNNILLGSALTTTGYYKVNLKDMTAVKITTEGQLFNVSDLANANLLADSPKEDKPVVVEEAPQKIVVKEALGDGFISLYPNPSTGGAFKVSFDIAGKGDYEVQLLDLLGRVQLAKKVSVGYKNQLEQISYGNISRGVYIVKVLDAKKQSIFTEKLTIQ
jgi:Secretion system C-terminal sorting domain